MREDMLKMPVQEDASSLMQGAIARASRFRYSSLDLWRGIACLVIVILHLSLYWKYASVGHGAAGYGVAATILFLIGRMGIGVLVFFVISGYCIAATADSRN